MIVITHYQRLLDYIVPDVVHVLSAGRIVQDRRQGARARTRSDRLRAISERGGVTVMNAAIRPVRTQAELGLVDVYTTSRQGLPGGSDISAVRAAAFNHFVLAGLPHPRVEAWKYTDLRRLMRDAKPLAAPPDAAAKAQRTRRGWHARRARLPAAGDRRTVRSWPELSDLAGLEPGLTVRSMAEALALDEPMLSQGLGPMVPADDPALALNTALAGDGVVITVSPDVTIERPIHLVFVNTSATPAAMVTRSLVVVGRGARATLIETHEGPDRSDYQVNTALQLVVGDEARVDHVKITREGNAAIHVATLLANIGARAKFNELGLHDRRRRRAQSAVRAARGRRHRSEPSRPEPAGRPATCRYHARRRPRRRRQPEP